MMQPIPDTLILVNGKDQTDSIVFWEFRGGYYEIVFSGSTRVYRYNPDKIQILTLNCSIDPASVIFKYRGRTLTDICQILCFGEYYRILRAERGTLTCHMSEVEVDNNCLYSPDSRELFGCFKELAAAISLKTEQGINILQRKYEKITTVEESTVLAKYLNPRLPVECRADNHDLIYPFGLNRSQKQAVENAFSSQISIIQGPPGTGKTQTILNIIANALCKGKTVAVVSNNNSATGNVAEKLEKKGLSFLTAFLGSYANKEQFLLSQTGLYPDMHSWVLPREDRVRLAGEVNAASAELDSMLDARNRVAQIAQELLALTAEQHHFRQYRESGRPSAIHAADFRRLSSDRLLTLWLEYEHRGQKPLGFFRRLLMALRFGSAAPALFGNAPEEVIPFLQELYYQTKARELQAEKNTLESKLQHYRFEEKLEQLRSKSMTLFKAELAQRYPWQSRRQIFGQQDFRGASHAFASEYPVILSTTYSIRGTLSSDFVYDYLIVDEASQVDLVTGVLAFSCAKNIVIVGDRQQLPNVLTSDDIRRADAIWNRYRLDGRYRFSTHSMLSSAAEIWKDAPSVLLREHYRCHPKIAAFFNRKFYGGQLIVMTEDRGEEQVLTMYRTAPGNHARGHLNQRQIDVIRTEVLPALQQQGYSDIGIITPYRDQVAAIQSQLGADYDVATVHKFQGREKEAIVLASVDNVIGEFVDDPNMLNVAVSRAVKSLSVVISASRENEKTNYGDLAKYITYHNFQVVDSRVFSVFDLLYKGYAEKRRQYLKKHRRVSEYDSENLAYAVVEGILQMPEFSRLDCVMHASLSTLVRNYTHLTEEEARYASSPLTHIDLLLFNRMDKAPVLAIEVDGTAFHADGSRQAQRDSIKNSVLQKCGIPLLRLRTNESGEQERICAMLRMQLQNP